MSALATLLVYTFIGILMCAAIGLVGERGDATGKLIAITPVVLGAIAIFGIWLPAFARRMSLPGRVTFPAEVVRRWSIGSDEVDYFVAVDDGSSPQAATFQIEPAPYRRISAGDTVLVTFSPRTRHVHEIQKAADPRPTT
jgi:hypothetical protein